MGERGIWKESFFFCSENEFLVLLVLSLLFFKPLFKRKIRKFLG